jgi:hypothetical protein
MSKSSVSQNFSKRLVYKFVVYLVTFGFFDYGFFYGRMFLGGGNPAN